MRFEDAWKMEVIYFCVMLVTIYKLQSITVQKTTDHMFTTVYASAR
jgi:hypothetical protein